MKKTTFDPTVKDPIGASRTKSSDPSPVSEGLKDFVVEFNRGRETLGKLPGLSRRRSLINIDEESKPSQSGILMRRLSTLSTVNSSQSLSFSSSQSNSSPTTTHKPSDSPPQQSPEEKKFDKIYQARSGQITQSAASYDKHAKANPQSMEQFDEKYQKLTGNSAPNTNQAPSPVNSPTSSTKPHFVNNTPQQTQKSSQKTTSREWHSMSETNSTQNPIAYTNKKMREEQQKTTAPKRKSILHRMSSILKPSLNESPAASTPSTTSSPKRSQNYSATTVSPPPATPNNPTTKSNSITRK